MKTKINGILTLLLAFMVQMTFAQERTISGVVSDDMGPVADISVKVKGTTTGTVTDFDGNYAVKAKSGDVLVFTHVSYEAVEKTVGASDKINVTVKMGGSTLDEVVVTAMGIKKQEKALGYSVQKVDSEQLTRVKDVNIVNSLSGKIAGINVTGSSGAVGASSRITIRGVSTIFGNDQPLMVVDGVVLDNTNYGNSSNSGGADVPNGLADINPEDIETINVLKGGSATSLYGMRGANGVIVIVTKSGRDDGKLGIAISSSVTMDNAYVIPDYQNSFGQGHSQAYFEFKNGYGYDGGSVTGDGGVDESWGPALDAGLEFIQWDSFDGNPRPWISHPDNVKNFYETGVTTTNNVTLSKGGDNFNSRVSVGMTDIKGIVYNTDLTKMNIGGKFSVDLSDKWTTSLSVNYINTNSDNRPSVGYGDSNNQIAQLVWSARNVDFEKLKDYNNLPIDPISGTPINWNMAFNNNPYWTLDNNTNAFNRDRINGFVSARYKFNDNLTFDIQSGIDYFSSINADKRLFGTYGSLNGSYEEIRRNRTEINTQALLNYNIDIVENLKFDISVGGNLMNNKYHRLRMSAPELQLPGFYNISNVRDGVTPVNTQTHTEQKISSVFGTAQFAYKNYLFLNFTGRNDWASVLPINNNNFFYPSANLSAVVSDMFELDKSYVSFLKLRGGYSKVGSAGPLSPYSIQQTYSFSSQPWGTTPVGFLGGTLWNPNIKNQTTTEMNVGLDGRFFKNRLTLDVSYYNKETSDLILPKSVSATSGFTFAWQNAATISNKGIELNMTIAALKSDDLNLDFTFNFGKNTNIVQNIDDDSTTDEGVVNLGSLWNVTTQAREGQPIGVLYGPGFERAPNGEIIYENGLPQIDATYKVLGNSTPDWTGGLNINLSYKNFDLSTLFDVKKGGDIYSQTNSWGKLSGVLEETLEGRETGVIGDGVMFDSATNSYVPNNVTTSSFDYFQTAYSQNIAESSVYDASFVKWREMSLRYSLPSKLIKSTGINAVSLAVTARNLAILYKNVPHIDPESAFSNSLGQQGLEYAQTPPTRSVGLSLNVKF